MMGRIGWKAIVAICLMAFGTQVEAKRTLVDFDPNDVNFENPQYTFLSGYCGVEDNPLSCTTAEFGFADLGLSINFGGDPGDPDYQPLYDSIKLYGNGQITFSNFGGNEDFTAITPGYNDRIVPDGLYGTQVWEQSATLSYANTSGFRAQWVVCDSSQTPCTLSYDMRVDFQTTGATGLKVYIDYGDNPDVDSGAGFLRRGSAVDGVPDPYATPFTYPDADETGTGYSFFIPATFPGFPNNPDPVGGVPETSTWLMMALGFGAIGWATRRRRMLLRPVAA